MGSGFDETIPGFENMSDQELLEAGVNDSIIHVDYMIGSQDLDITGRTRDGKEVAIFRSGNWAI